MNLIAVRAAASFAVGAACALSLVACGGGDGSQMTGFADSALVANNAGVVATATTLDTNLSNPCGLVTSPGLPFWIADNNSNLATLYSGTGQIQTNAVTGSSTVGIFIPPSAAGVPANPTEQVYNGNGGFLI